jgi:hypothetical protein
MDQLMGKKKLIPVLGVLLMLSAFSVTLHGPAIASADKPQSAGKVDEQGLMGRWVRPDGGYVLELKEIRKNGDLKAAYFNPQPIKVFEAGWKRKQGMITVFVELRDVNYPGSKYNLHYDPKTNSLKGTYFQAVYGETYDVEFVRDYFYGNNNGFVLRYRQCRSRTPGRQSISRPTGWRGC